MADVVSKIRITVDSAEPQAALKAMRQRLKELEEAQKKLNLATESGRTKSAAYRQEQKALKDAIKNTQADMTKFTKVIDNLSQATGRQLRAALREVKKEMQATASGSKDMSRLRNAYDAINRQIKIMEGSLKNVEGQMGTLQNKTDGWLSSAIQQQKNYLASLDNTNDAGYKKQLSLLQQLEAEEKRRAAITLETNATKATETIQSGTASAAELGAARQALLAKRATMAQGAAGTPEATALANVNNLLRQCDEQLGLIQGKEKQIVLTEEQMAVKMTAFSDKVKAGNASPKELRDNLAECRAQLDKMATGSAGRQKWVQWAKQFESALSGVKNEGVNVQKVLGNLKGASLEDLRAAAAKLKEEMAGIERNSKQFNDVKQQFNQINAELNRASNAINGINKSTSAWKTTLRNLTTYFGLFQVFSKVSSWIQDVVKGNLKMSDQLSQIRMVSGLAMSQINGLSKELQKIDTRTSLSDLQQIAYEGSKLGFGEYGVKGLTDFTRIMNQVNVALKEQLGEDTMPALSKMVENMGDIKKMGVEKALLSTSSAIFKLAATSTASAGPIMDFAKRMYGLAKASRMATPELLAFASASDAMGQDPEVGATAMSKMLVAIQKSPHAVENAFGMKRDTIQNLYNAGKISEALVDIFQRLKAMGSMNAQAPLMKILGSDGQRLIGWVTAMSQNVDMLQQHLQTANQAFQQGTAVTDEYNLRQQTAEGILERANNLWSKALINDEGVDVVKNLTTQWYNLSKAMTSSNFVMNQLKGSLLVLVGALKLLMMIGPSVLQIFATIGLARGIAKLPEIFNELRTSVMAFAAPYSSAIRAHYAERDALRLADQQKEMTYLQQMTASYVAYINDKEAFDREWQVNNEAVNAMSGKQFEAYKASQIAIEAKYTSLHKALVEQRIAAGESEDVTTVNQMSLDRLAISVAQGKITQKQADAIVTDLQTKAIEEYNAIQNGANLSDATAAGNAALKTEAKTASTAATEADTVATGMNTGANTENATSSAAAAAGATADATAKEVDTAATNEATVAQERLNAAQKANIWGALIGVILLVAQAVYSFASSTNEAKSEQDDLNDSVKQYYGNLEVETTRLKQAREAIDSATVGTKQRQAAIDSFNKNYGQYLDKLLNEKSSAQDVAKAYEQVNNQLRQKMALEGMQQSWNKYVTPRLQGAGEAKHNYYQHGGGGDLDKLINESISRFGAQPTDVEAVVRAFAKNRKLNLSDKEIRIIAGNANYDVVSGAKSLRDPNGLLGRTDFVKLTPAVWQAYAFLRARQYTGAANYQSNIVTNSWKNTGPALPEPKSTVTFEDTGGGKTGKTGRTGRTGRTGTGNSPKEQLDIAKKQVDGLVSNIESYYNNQMAAVEDMVAQGQKSRAQADMYLNTLKIQQNKALQQARLAISGQANNWDEFKDNEMGLTKDWVDVGRGTEELSKYLLDAIRKANVGSIQKVLTNLEGGRDILREVITNATKNGYEINKLLADIQQKAMQSMYQYDYLNTYFKDSESDMIQAGFVSNTDRNFFEAPPTPKVDKTDKDDKGKGSRFDNPNNPTNMQDFVVMGQNLSPYRQMMKQYVQNSSRYLQYNPNDDVQLYQFLQDIASGGNLNENGGAKELTGWAKNFSQMTNKDKTGWLDILGTTGVDPENDLEVDNIKQKMEPIRDSIRAYFNFLFDQDNKYYTDVIEKQEKRAAKIISSRWENSVDKIQFDVRDRQLKQQKDNEDVFGRPQRFWQPWGFSDTLRNNDVDMNLAVNNAASARKQYQQAQSFMTSRERINNKKQAVTDAYAEQNAAQSDLDNLQRNATPNGEQNAQNQKAAQDRLDKAKDALEKAQNDLALEQSKTLAPETLKKYEDAWTNAQKEIGTLVNQYVTNRIETLKQWTDPIEQLGTAMGEAFATMTEDAEKGRDAVKAALLDMVKAYGQATIKILNELMMEKVKEMLLRKTYGKKNAKIEEENNEKINDSAKDSGKAKTSILTKAWKGIKSLFKKQKKDEVKETQDKQKATQDVEQKGADAKEILNVETGKKIADATTQIDTQTLQQKEQNTKQDVADESNKTQANTTLGIANGASKIIAKLGWWGIPLVAVITALLNGLLSFALSKVSSLFGGGSKDSSSGTNTKLVSGMLTYDAGNVQAFSGVNDGKTYPVVGNDGKVYAAKDGGELSTGLVKDPITTLVNGQPALVAERGPEMVIGRETTAAMMMARPDLISEIVKFDRNRSGMNYRMYDAGNVQDFASGDGSVDMVALMNGITKMNETGEMLAQVLAVIQANGIQAHINKYGRGGLATQAADGADFMRRNSGDRLWKK